MVDTWATVGSLCPNLEKNVHLSGGVGIGGVLENHYKRLSNYRGNNAFIGSRCIVVEGVRVEKRPFGLPIVVLTSLQQKNYRLLLRPNRVERKMVFSTCQIRLLFLVVIPKKFPAGRFQVPCALIIGYQKRKATNKKTSLMMP